MENTEFLDVAIKNLPGGLILVDLDGKVRAINQTGATLLGLPGLPPTGKSVELTLKTHPKIAHILMTTCKSLEAASRQEITTERPDGEQIVLGYSTLLLKNDHGKPIGVGMSFQDITRFIPLMDAHQFLDIALKNLPGGLIFIDLQGKVRGINQMAQRILGFSDPVEPGTECHKALADYPQVVKVLLSTCQSQKAVNRQELQTRRAGGEKVTLGYGTLIIRNEKNVAIGVGLTFQDITRYIPLPLQSEFVRLVDRFFTPFALIMVIAAIFLGFAEPAAQHVAVAVAVCLGLFNEASVWICTRKPAMAVPVGYLRLALNFVANIVLVYLLGTFWGPMWLLFVLTPVATALYADWKKTLFTAVMCAGALLGIYASRGLSGAVGWGQASLHAAFIVFISLFVNSIARMVMQMRSGSYAASPKTSVSPANSAHKVAA